MMVACPKCKTASTVQPGMVHFCCGHNGPEIRMTPVCELCRRPTLSTKPLCPRCEKRAAKKGR